MLRSTHHLKTQKYCKIFMRYCLKVDTFLGPELNSVLRYLNSILKQHVKQAGQNNLLKYSKIFVS